MKYLIMIMGLFLLYSCTLTRTIRTNIVFKKETPEALLSFLEGKGAAYDRADIATLNGINAWISYNDTGKLSVTEAYFFNKEGYRVKDNFKGTSCGQVINNAHQINTAPSDNKEHITTWLKDYDFLFEENPVALPAEEYDAYVIVTWAKFVDPITTSSNENAVAWYKSLRNNHDMKIKTIFLNLDIQDTWTLSAEQEKALDLK